jgi:hypothetical protein
MSEALPETPDAARTFYGLRDQKTGALFRVRPISCYDEGYELTLDASSPLFESSSSEMLQAVLLENPPSRLGSVVRPNWGGFKRGQMLPVRVSVTVASQFIELPTPLRLATVHTRDVPRKVAEQYAGKAALADLAPETRFVFWLVALEPEQSLAQVQAAEGELAYSSNASMRRRIFKALAVPEEYVPLLNGRAGALVIASTLC